MTGGVRGPERPLKEKLRAVGRAHVETGGLLLLPPAPLCSTVCTRGRPQPYSGNTGLAGV